MQNYSNQFVKIYNYILTNWLQRVTPACILFAALITLWITFVRWRSDFTNSKANSDTFSRLLTNLPKISPLGISAMEPRSQSVLRSRLTVPPRTVITR